MMMKNDWSKILGDYIKSPNFINLGNKIAQERTKYTIYPSKESVFKAFNETPYNEVKCVILGQDPYHGKDQAIGISFGINPNVHRIPLSLKEIHKELEKDLNALVIDFDYSLLNWCREGVLMLNTALTVQAKTPGSHIKLWKDFTNEVIRVLNLKKDLIWILLGSNAQAFIPKINNKHFIIKEQHPASCVYGNNGIKNTKIFTRVNEQLKGLNKKEIKWI